LSVVHTKISKTTEIRWVKTIEGDRVCQFVFQGGPQTFHGPCRIVDFVFNSLGFELQEAEAGRIKIAQHYGSQPRLTARSWLLCLAAGTLPDVSRHGEEDSRLRTLPPRHRRLSAELHEILSPLPLYPYMEVEVTALCHHPGSLDQAD
jgi:hypothetical protein